MARKNNSIKGVGRFTIKYTWERCACGKMEATVSMFGGECLECRAEKYDVAPHKVMEYELKRGIRQ